MGMVGVGSRVLEMTSAVAPGTSSASRGSHKGLHILVGKQRGSLVSSVLSAGCSLVSS